MMSTLEDPPPPRSVSKDVPWTGLLAAAACIGMLGGWAEAAVAMTARFALDRRVWLGPHVLWMAPLVGGVVAGLATATASLLARWLPRPARVPFALGVAGSCAAWSLLLAAAPQLGSYSTLLVAAGLGVQGGIMLGKRPHLVRRTVPLVLRLALLLIAIPTGLAVWNSLREWTRLRTLVRTSPGAPNVLLITIDTERAESLELYGGPPGTSTALAQLGSEGVVFQRALATSPWTLPTHASLFTGKHAHETSANWRTPLDDRFPTLAERLGAAGYATGGFVANALYCNREFGLGRGFVHYEDYVASWGELLLDHRLMRRVVNSQRFRRLIGFDDVIARRDAQSLNRSFLRWVDRVGPRPFFAFINYFEPHEPYLPPRKFLARFGGRRLEVYRHARQLLRRTSIRDENRDRLFLPGIDIALQAYAGAIASADAGLGELVRDLDRRGILDRTLVIVTADHGEQFGEHPHPTRSERLYTHGNSLYAQVLWVPLVMRWPEAVPAGVRVPDPVSLRDVAATIAELTKLPDSLRLPGVPLSGLWSPSQRTRPSPALSTVIPYDRNEDPTAWIAALASGRFHYIRYGDGRRELFDLEADPAEARNLAESPDSLAKETLKSLETQLAWEIRDWSPRHLSNEK